MIHPPPATISGHRAPGGPPGTCPPGQVRDPATPRGARRRSAPRGARCGGQATLETLIASAFVLVPLFIMVSLLGKLIDVRHSAIQAARYESWEYTVWYSDERQRPDGFTRVVPVKDLARLRNETRKRFFSRTDLVLQDADGRGWSRRERRPLWTDHAGRSLYGQSVPVDRHVVEGPDDPPGSGLAGGVVQAINGAMRVIRVVFRAMSRIMGWFGIRAGFTVTNPEGYFASAVEVPVRISPVPFGLTPADARGNPFPTRLRFTAGAGVLSDGWNAGGRDHAAFQVGGLVPTKLLDIPALNTVRDIVSRIFLAPELGSDSLQFGYIAHDAVHPDRLEPAGAQACVPRVSAICYGQ